MLHGEKIEQEIRPQKEPDSRGAGDSPDLHCGDPPAFARVPLSRRLAQFFTRVRPSRTHNLIGWFGAFLSHAMLTGIGLTSYMLVAFIAVFGAGPCSCPPQFPSVDQARFVLRRARPLRPTDRRSCCGYRLREHNRRADIPVRRPHGWSACEFHDNLFRAKPAHSCSPWRLYS